jgi:hypothetical protein
MPTDIFLWYFGEELIFGSGLRGFPVSVRSINLEPAMGRPLPAGFSTSRVGYLADQGGLRGHALLTAGRVLPGRRLAWLDQNMLATSVDDGSRAAHEKTDGGSDSGGSPADDRAHRRGPKASPQPGLPPEPAQTG